MSTLPELIQQRIDTAYDGNQAAFARAIGEKPPTVNSWIKGRVGLPEPNARRRLARELGIRHVDILVMAGELWPEEVAEIATQARSEADDILSELDAEIREGVLTMLRRFRRTVELERLVSDQPAPVGSGER